MATGQIAEYQWAELSREERELLCPDVVRRLAEFVRGLSAVNVSWDSGHLDAYQVPFGADWREVDGHAVSPPVSDDLIASWPRSSCGFDEWYFFRHVPRHLKLSAFCNWLGMSLSNWSELDFPGGFNLKRQLATYQPELVIGEGYRIFVLSKERPVIDRFLSTAGEP